MIDASLYQDLYESIVADLTVELNKDDDFNADVLAIKVKNVIREVYTLRHYEYSSYDDNKIADDLWNYYSVILNVSRYDYNKIGAEGESEHSENDIKRVWVSRNNLLSDVYGFVKIL